MPLHRAMVLNIYFIFRVRHTAERKQCSLVRSQPTWRHRVSHSSRVRRERGPAKRDLNGYNAWIPSQRSALERSSLSPSMLSLPRGRGTPMPGALVATNVHARMDNGSTRNR